MIPLALALRYAALALILVLVQLNVGYIGVESVTPDLLVIFAVYIALREGQFTGVLIGFAVGLLFDVISSDVPGTNALSKTLAGFVAGFYSDEALSPQEAVGTPRFLGIVALAAVVHNIIYFFFYVRATDLSFGIFFLRNGVASALYTTVIAVFVMLLMARKKTW